MSKQRDPEPLDLDGLSPEQQRRLSELLDGYFCSLENGRPLNREDLVARHPDLAAPITAYLESLKFLTRI